jgi:adenosine deaminase
VSAARERLCWYNPQHARQVKIMQARFVLALLLAATAAQLPAQTVTATPGEARASHALEAARKLGPPELYAFLQPMPKGADLHMHLSGAIYAETFLAEAVQQKLCVDAATLKLVAPAASGCAAGNVPAATLRRAGRQLLHAQLCAACWHQRA